MSDPKVQTAPAEVVSLARPVRGGELDSLRFWASMLIVLYHYANEGPLRLIRFHPVFGRGYLATDFFLMLSGFVLAIAYGRQILAGMGTPTFLRRRIERIWPGHAMILLIMGVLAWISPKLGWVAHNASQYEWNEFLPQLFLLHAWGLPQVDGWNLPSWSLSALIGCYALFPVLWRGLSKLRSPLACLGLALAIIVLADAAAWRVFDRSIYDLPLQFGVLRALPLFVVGAIFGRLVQLGWLSAGQARAVLGGGAVVLVISQALGEFDAIGLLAISMTLLGAGSLPVDRPKAWAKEGARLSYALFISHTLIGTLWYSGLHTLVQHVRIGLEYQWPLWAMGFPLALFGAWGFDRYLDQPVQAWIAAHRTVKTKV